MPELENKLAAPEGCAPLTCSSLCDRCSGTGSYLDTMESRKRRVFCNHDATYRRCACGSDCNWIDDEEQCWGQVDMEDEDDEGNQWHTCEGHREMLDWCRNSQTARKYIPPTND
jgi:hypothetical protein